MGCVGWNGKLGVRGCLADGGDSGDASSIITALKHLQHELKRTCTELCIGSALRAWHAKQEDYKRQHLIGLNKSTVGMKHKSGATNAPKGENPPGAPTEGSYDIYSEVIVESGSETSAQSQNVQLEGACCSLSSSHEGCEL
eukprot:6153629-Amphidinium_carterae.1